MTCHFLLKKNDLSLGDYIQSLFFNCSSILMKTLKVIIKNDLSFFFKKTTRPLEIIFGHFFFEQFGHFFLIVTYQ